MKRVDELGISPPPWEEDKETKVIWGGDYSVHERSYRHRYQSMEDANARLIAAAPKLYEALYNAIQVTCDCCDFEYDGAECKECPRHWWRDVLAKAAGEEANND